MKNIWNVIDENRKQAINLMYKNNVKSIDFVDDEGEDLIQNVPFVLVQDRYNTIMEVQVASVRIDEEDNFYVWPNDEDINEEISIDDTLSTSENDVYLAIEQYFYNKK